MRLLRVLIESYRKKETTCMKNRMTLIGIVATLLLTAKVHAADTFTIDPAHTRIGFSARHFGINYVKGVFKEFTGTLVTDGDTLKEATGTIQVQSIDTGVAQRDNHLRTADFFDATNHPTITFKTKRVEKSGDDLILIADFTMRGVTKELRLPATLSKPIKDPWGNTRVGLEAKTKLNRKDYGIRYNDMIEGGIPAVGDEIGIEINAEAIKGAAK